MDDQSIWKKELSFGRKQKDGEDSPATGEKPTSVWKKELSFKRKPKDVVEGDAVADTPDEVPAVEEPVIEEPAAEEEPLAAEPELAEETVWKKEVSFDRKPAHDDPVEAEPVVAEATAAEATPDASESVADQAEHVSGSDPKTGPEETVWKKEVSFSRKPEAGAVSEEPVAEEAVADVEPVVDEEPVAAEERVAAEVPVAVEEPIAAEEPVAAEAPVTQGEPEATEEPVAVEEPVVVEEPVAEEPIASELVARVEAETVAEPWNAPPAMPPAPAVEAPAAIVPAPVPSAEVHPPVAAADLPPLPVEDAPKVPFWKKELSLGGKKRDRPVKERKQKAAKVKGERAPKTKEPKQPKERKDRKQKVPKVKAERGNSKGRLVGLKIGASQLAAARVSNNGTAELLQVAREPLAPGIIVGGELRDPDALAEALKDFFAKHGLPKKGVRLGIANNRIGVRTFDIAGVADPKQLANAIRFRAQEALPIPIDEAVLDYQVLSEGVGEDGQPTKRVLLVVAYRELIDRYVDACKKAGIALVGIDLEAFALLRALQAPQEGTGTDATAALVVVAIGHERSTFAVSDGRVCEFTRVLEWGGSALNVAIARAVDAAPSEVEDTKRALSLLDEMVPDGISADQAKKAREAMRRAIQTFARELVSSLQYYQNQPGSLGIGEIVLTGGTAHLPGLAGELERLIGVRVRVGDPLARMKVSKKIGQPEQVGSLAVAIGLGIED
jgi:type IV pilus assembly protein PilM